MNINNNIIETNPFDHIMYEFLMYVQASICQSTEQFVTNLLVDSRMVHMRNIAYFFCSKKDRRKKDLHYSTYILERLPNEIDHELLNTIQRIASNSTCHLLKGRFSEAFKHETAVLEQTVFPILITLIKNFLEAARESVRPEYEILWQDNQIQENVSYLEKMISDLRTDLNEIIITSSTGSN